MSEYIVLEANNIWSLFKLTIQLHKDLNAAKSIKDITDAISKCNSTATNKRLLNAIKLSKKLKPINEVASYTMAPRPKNKRSPEQMLSSISRVLPEA